MKKLMLSGEMYEKIEVYGKHATKKTEKMCEPVVRKVRDSQPVVSKRLLQ